MFIPVRIINFQHKLRNLTPRRLFFFKLDLREEFRGNNLRIQPLLV